jgi:hypothetical protein
MQVNMTDLVGDREPSSTVVRPKVGINWRSQKQSHLAVFAWCRQTFNTCRQAAVDPGDHAIGGQDELEEVSDRKGAWSFQPRRANLPHYGLGSLLDCQPGERGHDVNDRTHS